MKLKLISGIGASLTTAPLLLALIGRVDSSGSHFGSFQNPIPCWFLKTYGVPCASCGLTRGWICVAHGDIQTALNFNPHALTTFLTVSAISLLLWTITFKNLSIKNVFILYILIVILFFNAWIPIIQKNLYLYKLYGISIW